MSQSLRDVLHQIVNELSVSSEVQRDRLHAAVDAATQEPVIATGLRGVPISSGVTENSTPTVTTTPVLPTADNPYAQPG